MSTVKYRTGRHSMDIVPVAIARETGHSIWVDGHRLPKRAYFIYHDTWTEARDCLKKRAMAEVECCTRELAEARSELDRLSSLTPPVLEEQDRALTV